MRIRHARNLILTATAASVYCSPAIAQNADDQADAAAATGDIVVTAQRTETLLSKTPVAVTAIGAEELQRRNVANPADLGDLAPNLSVVRNNGLQITIRGVTSNDNTEKGDPSAAFLLDGIYIARPQAQEVSFYDIQRVEVLRGPQGTLYGRNTTAGVINVITNKPKDYFEAAGNFTYGNFDTVRADAMINIPASDAVAFRLAGAVEKRDSYLVKEPGDSEDIDPFKENYSVRGQALFQLGGMADLLIRADYSDLSGSEMSAVLGTNWYAPLPSGAPGYTNPEYIGDRFDSEGLREISYDLAVSPETSGSTWGLDGELNWDVGPGTMTYLGSYREFQREGVVAAIRANGPGINTVMGDYDQLSQELRFALNSFEALDLQFGAYYFEENSTNNLILPGIVGFEQGPTRAESYAFFGQGTVHATDTLRFTAGGRWSHDDKERVGRTFNPVTDALISPNNAAVTSSKFTWRLGVDYDLTPEALLYAVVSTGYKAGGFNGGCEAGTPNCTNPRPLEALYYDPETLTAYEVGLKTRALDNMLRLSATAFYYDYTNLQVSSIGEYNGVPQQVTQNAAAATVKGAELEGILTPAGGLRLDATLTWLDAEYESYNPLGAGNPPAFDGLALDRAPEWVANLGIGYTLDFANGSALEATARMLISSEYFMSSQTSGQRFRQPSYTRSSLTLTYRLPDDRYYVGAYVNNLEDDIQAVTAGFGQGVQTVTPSDPRTYGIRAGFRF